MVKRFASKLGAWVHDESGAITVDWVVLVAGVLTLSFVVMASVTGGAKDYADTTETGLTTLALGTGSAPG